MCCKCFAFLIIFIIVGAFNFIISWEGPSIDENIKCNYRNLSAVCNREIDWWKLHGNVSTSIFYLPEDHGLSLSLKWDDTVVYNESISERNLIPFGYIEIPKVIGSISFRLYNLSITERFHCCLEAREKLFWILPSHHHIIGCIDFSLKFLTDDLTLLNKIPYKPRYLAMERKTFLLQNFFITFSLSVIVFVVVSTLLHCHQKKYSRQEDDEVPFAEEVQ